MKTFLISLFWLVIFATILAILLVSECRGAPAPMPRRERVAYTPPRADPVHWYGHWVARNWPGWDLQFLPRGLYRATHADGTLYVGTWTVTVNGISIAECNINRQGPENTYRYRLAFSEFSRQ